MQKGVINKDLNIIFLPISIKEGMAGTQRLRNYLPFLCENNIPFNNIHVSKEKGQRIYENESRYIYSSRIQLITIIQFLILFKLIKLKKKGHKNIIYNYGYINVNNFIYLLISKLIGYKIIIDIVEDNRVNDSNIKLATKILQKSSVLFLKLAWIITNGVIVISDFLENYIEIKTYKKIPLLKIPITIDKTEYANYKAESVTQIIFYGGSFSPKDGLSYLLSAFDLLIDNGYNYKLVIAGKGIEEDMKIFHAKLDKIKHKDNVEYKGYLSREKYNKALNNCDILCMTRINSNFANAGFPFKLGEMLMTGKPVIATRVGEIEKYLINNTDAIIIEPENVFEIYKSFKYLIDNPQLAESIGNNGREKALVAFDADEHSKRLINFLNNI